MILTSIDLVNLKKNTDLLRTKKSYWSAVIKLVERIKHQYNLFGKMWKIWAIVTNLLYLLTLTIDKKIHAYNKVVHTRNV